MKFKLWEKIAFGVLLAAWLTFISNFIGDALVQAEHLETPAYVVAVEDKDAEPAGAQETAAADDALALLVSADPARGIKVFGKCKACHTTEEGGKNKVGPNLWDIVGKAKASSAGFKYSPAMTELGGEWAYEDLDAFLTNPKAMVPKTKMAFAGVKKASDRASVILFLRGLSAAPKALP